MQLATSAQAEGSDKLKDFLQHKAKGIKNIDDIHTKFTQSSIDYDELLRMSEDVLTEIMKSDLAINALTRFRIIDALKKLPESQIYKDINQPKQQTKAILLSSKQNDFVVSIHSKQEISVENIRKLEQTLSNLDKTSTIIKSKINKQYILLIKMLEKRKYELNNNIDNIINNKKQILNKKLSSAIKTKDTLKNIGDDIEKCLSSNSLNFTAKQAKIEKIIQTSSNELKSLKEYVDKNMEIKINTNMVYACNEKEFEQFINNKMDWISEDKIELSQEPIFDKHKQLISFKIKYAKNMVKQKYKVQGYFENEQKQNDDEKSGGWIEFGEFDLKYNNSDNNQDVQISIFDKKVRDGLYRIRLYGNNICLSKSLLKIEKFVCWNDQDKDDIIILSNNNLTLENKFANTRQNHLVRATVGYQTGSHSFQITVDKYNSGGNGAQWAGFATKVAPRIAGTNEKGADFWGFKLSSFIIKAYNGKGQKHTKGNIKTGDVIKLTLDMNNRILNGYINGNLAATISNIQWNNRDMYPAIYAGCFKPNIYTTIFDC